MSKILHKQYENGLGEIVLNRPEAINALSFEMLEEIDRILRNWEKDETIKAVLIKGAGERGYCAGGDVKSFYYAQGDAEKLEVSKAFFTFEYKLDDYIHYYKKPIVAIMDGVCMGGGVGLVNGAPIRIVTERTKWAMPEVNISLFPDIGAGYFLNQCPGLIGRYLGLTGNMINGADALFAKIATHYLSSSDLPVLYERLETLDLSENVQGNLETAIENLAKAPEIHGIFTDNIEEINERFNFDTVEEILEALENGQTPFAKETFASLSTKSPISLKVTLKMLIESIGKSYTEVLATDLILATNFLTLPDFYEGLRAVLVDKDRKPDYFYKNVAQVTTEDVEKLLAPV